MNPLHHNSAFICSDNDTLSQFFHGINVRNGHSSHCIEDGPVPPLDATAVSAVIRKLIPGTRRARGLFGRDVMEEDLIQDFFEFALGNSPHVCGAGFNFVQYAAMILRVAANRERTFARQRRGEEGDARLEAVPTRPICKAAVEGLLQDAAAVHAVLDGLCETLQSVAQLVFIEEYSVSDVATLLRISPTAVSLRLRRIRATVALRYPASRAQTLSRRPRRRDRRPRKSLPVTACPPADVVGNAIAVAS